MQPGFQSFVADVRTSDGRNFALLKPLVYMANDGRVFIMPATADAEEADGISAPSLAWALRPPFGIDWLAGVLHDGAYRNTLQKPDGTLWTLPKPDCDLLLREAALSLGDTTWAANVLYEAVRLGGQPAFDQDRKAST